jgi:hypothetical protein
VDVIGLNRQLFDAPPVPGALGFDQGFTVRGHLAGEDGLTTLRTPDEVVDDEVDAVFVALIIHVDAVSSIDIGINSVAGKQRAKALDKKPA